MASAAIAISNYELSSRAKRADPGFAYDGDADGPDNNLDPSRRSG